MDKQTCAALLNILGFNSYNMNFEEFSNCLFISFILKKENIQFLLKSKHCSYMGSIVDYRFNQIHFKSYDTMIEHARIIHAKKANHN